MPTMKKWFNVRFGLDEFYESRIRDLRMPKNINLFSTLGFLTAVAYGVQAFTGIILMIYYIPHPDHAFRSVQEIMTTVPYGWLFREMHAVGSNLMISVVILHMSTVFLMGNYKRPRELTWLAGGLSLLFTLLFGLSGYLLPWSQLSYWATTVVTSMPTAIPGIGQGVSLLLRGGDQVTAVTLSRFFAIHVAILPPIFMALMALHLFLITRTGISATPFGMADEEKRPPTEYVHIRKTHPDGLPYVPTFFRKQMYMVMAFFVVMFFIITFYPTLFFPAEANLPADPLRTPAHIRPEWYLVPMYQFLKIVPNKFLGISLQVVIAAIFLFWPFLDTQEEKNVLKRPLLRGLFVCFLLAWFILLYWGRA
jgi:ubiquinol-cytochrome c reductase cytochrome b subunit